MTGVNSRVFPVPFGWLFALWVLLFPLRVAAANLVCLPTQAAIVRGAVGLQIFATTDQRSWDLVRELGLPWVRVEFVWKDIEPQPDLYKWDVADRIVAQAQASGAQTMAVLSYIPDWARDRADLPERFGRFAAAILARYGIDQGRGAIRYWEIFNEPNLPGYGWPKYGLAVRENAYRYAAMIKAMNLAVRPANPGAVLISGGLSPEGQPAATFLQAVYDVLDKRCFDILGLHPYGREGRLARTLEDARVFLRQRGDDGKPIWFTEYGTDHDRDRARLLESAFREIGQLEALFFFSERDFNRPYGTFGLVGWTYEKKQDFDCFKQLLQKQAVPTACRRD